MISELNKRARQEKSNRNVGLFCAQNLLKLKICIFSSTN